MKSTDNDASTVNLTRDEARLVFDTVKDNGIKSFKQVRLYSLLTSIITVGILCSLVLGVGATGKSAWAMGVINAGLTCYLIYLGVKAHFEIAKLEKLTIPQDK